MTRRGTNGLALVVALEITGCRDSPRSVPAEVGATPTTSLDASPAIVDANAALQAESPPSPLVMLRWRETKRRVTRDARGNEHWSVELELLVQGGTPSRVPLGRRPAYGFSAGPLEGGQITSVQSYMDAHGEYAVVTRPQPGELRVEAHGQDEALPGYAPPVTNVRTGRIRIPADAGVGVEDTVEDPERD